MKSLEEIKSISKTYNSGPIVKVSLEDAIKWIEAYRELVVRFMRSGLQELKSEEDPGERADAEAARIVEGK